MPCENASTLVMSYLDGELSEEQAAPLRGHLFDCPACREVAKDGKNLARWFAPGAALAAEIRAPAGFAARVARRAFAGDPGLPEDGVLVPAPRAGGTPILPFLLKLCSAAAVLLFVLSIAIRGRTLPGGDGLEAQYQPPWEKEGLRGEPELEPALGGLPIERPSPLPERAGKTGPAAPDATPDANRPADEPEDGAPEDAHGTGPGATRPSEALRRPGG